MNSPWAICLARDDGSCLAELRLFQDIEVAGTGTQLWVRGRHSDERLGPKLAGLPALRRYAWLPPAQIRPLAGRIPAGQLPELNWQPLETWLQIQVPVGALPASLPDPVVLQLVRSAREQEPELLLASLQALGAYAASAPQVRLARLQFAADAAGRTLIRGRPLPPLPGSRFVLHGAVAVPAGFAWEPAVAAGVLERRFGATGGLLVLWHEDGTFSRLHDEQFVPLSRAGVRASLAAIPARS